jgi:pilus assembly protein CpaB
MKNTRAVGMLIVSIVLGLAVTALAVGWVAQKGSVASNKVVVAVMDIELGSRLNAQMLTTVDWPSGSLPQGAFADLKELQDRVVKTSIQRGEAILSAKLAPLGTQGGLSAVIAEGKRAMTVRVNDVVGVAGFALPGNYVDVMVNAQQDREGRAEEGKQISKTVLEHVLVLAVAQEAGRDETKPKVVNAVTLELTLEDAEKLDLARNVGTLSLVLRNQVDKLPVMTAGITKKQLFGEKEVPVAKVAAVDDAKPVVKVVQRVRSMPVVAAVDRTCVEVVHNNTRALNCF